MTSPVSVSVPPTPSQHLRRERWITAVLGLVFVVLFAAAMVLLHQVPELNASDQVYATFYETGSHSVFITVGLNLVPFAGIDFLWLIVSIHGLLTAAPGPEPSPKQKAVQLAAGTIFVALLFAGTASAAAVAFLLYLTHGPVPPVSLARVLVSVGYATVFVFAVRFAGMFVITTSSLLRRAGLLPLWLTVLSYLTALFFLVSTTTNPAALLAFPAWVLVVSAALALTADQTVAARAAKAAAKAADPDRRRHLVNPFRAH